MKPYSRYEPILGVLGGLGPIASAEFLRTVYDQQKWAVEQEAPTVILHSEPSFPDRTQAFLRGECDAILEHLIESLQHLVNAGASQLVVCCVTMHHLLPEIPRELRSKIISLVDCVFSQVAQEDEWCLLLSSTGTRRLRIFEDHYRWPELHEKFVLPGEEDQRFIHREIIHAIKCGCEAGSLLPALDALLIKYSADVMIAGCTEVHVLARSLRSHIGMRTRVRCVDPLTYVARHFVQEVEYVREHPLEV